MKFRKLFIASAIFLSSVFVTSNRGFAAQQASGSLVALQATAPKSAATTAALTGSLMIVKVSVEAAESAQTRNAAQAQPPNGGQPSTGADAPRLPTADTDLPLLLVLGLGVLGGGVVSALRTRSTANISH